MKKYNVRIKKSALDEIDSIADDILNVSKSLDIAKKYIDGLYIAIQRLSFYGASLPFCQNRSMTAKYGKYIRRMNYRKIAVLFYVEEDDILIQEIKFQYSITE
jgi:plasmid stabilization system protein ParE